MATVTANITDNDSGIVIIKDTVPDGPQDFAFTDDILAPNAFDLDDDTDVTLINTQTFNNVAPGTYTVTETLPVALFTKGPPVTLRIASVVNTGLPICSRMIVPLLVKPDVTVKVVWA